PCGCRPGAVSLRARKASQAGRVAGGGSGGGVPGRGLTGERVGCAVVRRLPGGSGQKRRVWCPLWLVAEVCLATHLVTKMYFASGKGVKDLSEQKDRKDKDDKEKGNAAPGTPQDPPLKGAARSAGGWRAACEVRMKNYE